MMNAVKNLTEECFLQHPIWAWDESQTHHIPIESRHVVPDDVGTVFVKAQITPKLGPRLNGYVVLNGTVYAIAVFIRGVEFVFNKNAPDLAAQDLGALMDIINVAEFQLFPIRYETHCRVEGGGSVAGEFDVR